MNGRSRTHRYRRLLALAFTAVLIVGAVLLVALWLAFEHKPAWYQPARLDEPGIHRAHREVVAVADFISDRMVEGDRFEVVLKDRAVNEWLFAAPHIWPDARKGLPVWLSRPAVCFGDGQIRLGAHYASGGWRAIVSIGLSLGISDDGHAVHVALSRAYGGSLPVFRSLIERILDPWIHRVSLESSDGSEAAEPWLAFLRKVSSAEDLFRGVKIKNRFVWFNGRRPYRIDAIRIDDGALRLRVEPL